MKRSSTSKATPEGEGLRVTVTRGFDGVAALEERWRSFDGQCITTDFDYFHTVLESEPAMLEPLVMSVSRNEVPLALVLARVEDTALALKFGYRTLYRPRLRSLTIVYRGFLGEVDDDVSTTVVREVARLLERGEFEIAIFRRLGVDHPLYRAATTGPRFLMRPHYTRTTTCWERTLPSSLDAFMQSLSKSTRSGVKRYANKLERDFDGRLDVRRFSQPSDLDEYFRDAEAVASKSYQRGIGVGVQDDPAHRLRAGLTSERGWFRAYVLYLDGAPVAFCGGESYKGRFYYGIPGYDPAFRDYRVGSYILVRMIGDLCADDTVAVLDLGPGDAEYKRRFGDTSWQEADVHLFAPRARPIVINVLRTGILTTNDAVAAVARSLGIVGSVKQRWRRRRTAGGG